MGSSYRGRLAPSPTGMLHLGHVRTFVTAAMRAREADGVLVLRMEDLDPVRSRPACAAAMLEDLRWLGIDWQEGPDSGGPYAPYLQSQRSSLYLAAWQALVEQGCLYPCSCTRRQLRGNDPAQTAGATEIGSRTANEDEDDETFYPGTCRPSASLSPRQHGACPAGVSWRFRVPSGERISFEDGGYGARQYIAGRDFGDFLVWRRDNLPAYQLAVALDDAAMRVTEVVRGADLLKSTARQILVFRALGLTPPAWFHCPLVLDAAGCRLSKSAGALSIRALRERGCSPGAVLAMAGVIRKPALP